MEVGMTLNRGVPHAGKRYFQHTQSLRTSLAHTQCGQAYQIARWQGRQEEREAFLDFLMGVLVSEIWFV